MPLDSSIGKFLRDASLSRRCGKRWMSIIVLGGLFLNSQPGHAALPPLSFAADRVEIAGSRFEGLQLELGGDGRILAKFESMQGSGEAYIGGGVQLRGQLRSVEATGDRTRVAATVEALGLAGELELEREGDSFSARWQGRDLPLEALAKLPGLPAPAGWVSAGRFDAEVSLRLPTDHPASLGLSLRARDTVFDSPDGLYAGQGLRLELQADWGDLEASQVAISGALGPGELLLGDFYRDFAGNPLQYSATVSWDDHQVRAETLQLGDDGALTFAGRASLALEAPPGSALETEPEAGGERPREATSGADAWTLEADRLELAFPEAYRRYVEPAAAAMTLDGLEVTGRVVWSGEWQDGALVRGDLRLRDLSVVDRKRERFAVTGLEAQWRPGDYEFTSRLAWRGLLLGPINLGAGEAFLDAEPGTVALLHPLVLEVLGGRVDLAVLRITLPGGRADGAGEPDVALRMEIDGIDMRQLTSVLGWPEFTGSLSGDIPGVSLDDGVLAIDGQVRLDVFGGHVLLQRLGVERLFGVLPSLSADVLVENLDLEQLTSTFSFGQIAGRLDGYVHDLRMLDWRPVGFDAWLGTPATQSGSRDISRQAVNRLTTIGGGSATTALASPFMRMFSSFSYRRLGLGCRLQNNICELRGLSEDDSSVLILEGAGVPKITIRAFNRSVDWPQMVSNLLAISAENPVRVGKQPQGQGN